MQKITRTEITWIVNELLASAIRLEEMSEDLGGSEIMDLQSANLRDLADRLARAAITGDKRIAIR